EITYRCCQLYDLEPDIDRRSIARLAQSLEAELHHLETDLGYLPPGAGDTRGMASSLRRVRSRSHQLADAALDGDPAGDLISRFQVLMDEFRPVSLALAPIQDRHLQRTLQSVDELIRALHEPLLLPVSVDRSHVTSLITSLQRQVDTICDAMTLRHLLTLKDPQAALSQALNLRREIERLQQCAGSRLGDEALREHWRQTANAWTGFRSVCQGASIPAVDRSLVDVDAALERLRNDLGVRLAFDRRLVSSQLQELLGLVEQAEYHLGRWYRRTGGRQDVALMRASQSLIEQCRNMVQRCEGGNVSREDLARDAQELAVNWTRLQPQLSSSRTIDRSVLQSLSQDVSNHLLQLQTLLGIP
ncbi:MAG: hypothetical protein AAGD07_23995, partial [Planctomycetota bacterium]